jgi:hypothetical protein
MSVKYLLINTHKLRYFYKQNKGLKMDTQTIKKAIESKKAYNHLVNWALNKNCSISVFVEGEPEIEKSKDFQKIKEYIECADQTEIIIYDENNKRMGWALIIYYNDDQETVCDFSANKFMEEWEIEQGKFYEELEKVA